ncbi:hypothetical protein GN958_ATG04674 [Phytophthora infestans]|uniref:Uncharacterized protein n=1 Tax=Phytophthora infestans TaxID=4787 RepID=A0A8S9V4U6_PHYIN|nr:hypothetical protein GN958_ATG04674 [Phytophthora infestans]
MVVASEAGGSILGVETFTVRGLHQIQLWNEVSARAGVAQDLAKFVENIRLKTKNANRLFAQLHMAVDTVYRLDGHDIILRIWLGLDCRT